MAGTAGGGGRSLTRPRAGSREAESRVRRRWSMQREEVKVAAGEHGRRVTQHIQKRRGGKRAHHDGVREVLEAAGGEDEVGLVGRWRKAALRREEDAETGGASGHAGESELDEAQMYRNNMYG